MDWHDWKSDGYASSPALDHDVVALRISGTVRLMQARDGKTHPSIAMPGNVTLDPRGMESKWSWDKPGAVAIVRIPPTLLLDAAESALKAPPAAIELPNCFGRKDVFVERIITLFLDELRAPPHPAQTYITQALSSALACHIVCRFNSQGLPVQPVPVDMHTRAVQRVKDYIQENLEQHITLDTLASLANVSRFHFARMFRQSAGVSAMTFLERARMARAQALIRVGGIPLAQVAMLVGYADQSYFTRRFRLHVGVTPAAYAREFGGRRRRP
ncbi:helix-turn-helix transcriptional regulator [Massilia sp. RP-1-19]|uniref:Helix-turn-helix transcriptional regulator n=1 Tax=Massilia polaris TaxID=2728846 RepID=A0A848HTL2_9BURK|nr:helix-turn-helix transcriptional regulator [Massilia polaris]